MTYDTTTLEGQEQRIKEIVGEHIKKAKVHGDYHERMAQSWTGLSNRGFDGAEAGEPPQCVE